MTPAPVETNYEENAIWRLVGSEITSFGMNAQGEIYLTANRGDQFVIAAEAKNEVSLYQMEKRA